VLQPGQGKPPKVVGRVSTHLVTSVNYKMCKYLPTQHYNAPHFQVNQAENHLNDLVSQTHSHIRAKKNPNKQVV
jgi:hypothetical protein